MTESVRVKAVYDGKNLVLKGPVPVAVGEEIEVTLSPLPLTVAALSREERAKRFDEWAQSLRALPGVDWSDVDASRDHPEMYPDRW